MRGGTLILAMAAVVLLGGCALKEQIYFRPIGDPVRYSYTYYPELELAIPPDSLPAAGAAVGARGLVVTLENDRRVLVVTVRLVIVNSTDVPVEVRREEQVIENLDGDVFQAAVMHHYELERESVVVRPGLHEVIRLEFRYDREPSFQERLSFVYRFRYAMYEESWPEDVRFVQVMPGEIKPPPLWDGVIIIRF